MVKKVKTHNLSTKAAKQDVSEKEIDEFLAQSKGVVAWAEKNIRPILYVAGAIVVLAIVVTVARIYIAKGKADFSSQFISAEKLLDVPVIKEDQDRPKEKTDLRGIPTYFEDDTQKSQAVTAAMDEVIKKKPSSGVAGMARVIKAQELYQLGEYDAVIEELKPVLNDPMLKKKFGYTALETTGYAYEAKKQYKDALGFFEQLSKTGFYRDYGLYHTARMKELENDPAGAKEVFQKLVDEFPSSPLKSAAEKRLAAL